MPPLQLDQQYQLRPPWVDPPPGFRPIELNGRIGTVGANAAHVLDSEQMGSNERGWIKRLSLFSDDFTVCSFKLRRNKGEIHKYDAIVAPIGESGICEEVLIELPPGALFEILAVHTGVAGIRWRAWGWAYPSSF